MQRRGFLGAVATAAAMPLVSTAFAAESGFVPMTAGLRFPEGPVAMADGSVLVCEIEAGRITRVKPDGKKETVAETGGGPNGAAIGPDGALYVCNNGGFAWTEHEGMLIPTGAKPGHTGGYVNRVDLKTGKATVLYRDADAEPLQTPNDIVFDEHGGFWFTDVGFADEHKRNYGSIYYAKADGSSIKRALTGLLAPNGIGLSPDGKTLYVALIYERLLVSLPITGEGTVERGKGFAPGKALLSLPAETVPDSLRIEADGTVALAVAFNKPGIVRVRPNGAFVETVPFKDILTTNLAFGGKDLRTAYVTQSASGVLLKGQWPAPGLKLAGQKV
jgi:gluconolactonase